MARKSIGNCRRLITWGNLEGLLDLLASVNAAIVRDGEGDKAILQKVKESVLIAEVAKLGIGWNELVSAINASGVLSARTYLSGMNIPGEMEMGRGYVMKLIAPEEKDAHHVFCVLFDAYAQSDDGMKKGLGQYEAVWF